MNGAEQLRAIKVLIAHVCKMLGIQPCRHYNCITNAASAPTADGFSQLDSIPPVTRFNNPPQSSAPTPFPNI
jgi:hypothetical protein